MIIHQHFEQYAQFQKNTHSRHSKIIVVESLNGEASPLENSSKFRSQMALPSESKRGCDEACDQRVGSGSLLSFFPSCFSASHPVLISVPADRHPESSALTPGFRSGSDEF
jgi:hypothetical protein